MARERRPETKTPPWYGPDRRLPPYRFLPGRSPHPQRDPRGHAFGRPPSVPGPWNPEQWPHLETYLRGIDLFNRSYFWEAHEAWEHLWRAQPSSTGAARFLQGLINLSAAFLKAAMGEVGSARKLGSAALRLLRPFQGKIWMGVDVDPLLSEVEAYLSLKTGGGLPPADRPPPFLRLIPPTP